MVSNGGPYFSGNFVDRICLAGPGQTCTDRTQCYTSGCADGVCSSCDGPPSSYWIDDHCTADTDCCSGLVCAEFQRADFYQETFPDYLDAGASCCIPNGSTCSAFDGFDCCSPTCSGTTCVCVDVGDTCINDKSCCSGACLPSVFSYQHNLGGPLSCCQTNGEVCYRDDECCTGNCVNHACACVGAGGDCGGEAQLAPLGSAPAAADSATSARASTRTSCVRAVLPGSQRSVTATKTWLIRTGNTVWSVPIR